MLVVIFLRPLSILYDSLVWFRRSLLTIACILLSCISTSFSICFTAKHVCRSEFNNKRVLPDPVGISVDNDGNVYVVNKSSSNVVVISPDGQRHRQLLSSKDGLINPRVLYYDKVFQELKNPLEL
jgi:hypothetical protein